MKFYNTLHRKKEVFQPLEKGKVTLYTCGPTVYDYAHIGNFRAYIFEDLLRRFLEYSGYDVLQVMNITDIDDKTIRRSIEEKMSLEDFTDKYTSSASLSFFFNRRFNSLNLLIHFCATFTFSNVKFSLER